MRNRDEGIAVHHQNLDIFNWPLALCSISIWPWLNVLWEHVPGPTAFYMAVSALFMLFQMCDKLGLLERFKRRPKIADLPEEPSEH